MTGQPYVEYGRVEGVRICWQRKGGSDDSNPCDKVWTWNLKMGVLGIKGRDDKLIEHKVNIHGR